jgi:large subunit ribosomal protein L19
MANRATQNDQSFRVGDTVKVHYKLIEKETVSGKAKKEKKEEVRERVQIFEGIVIAIKGNSQALRMFTVRRIGAGNIGIERIFPVMSPWVKKIEIVKSGIVRRAKLYYLREKKGKEQEKLKERKVLKKTAKLKEKESTDLKKETKRDSATTKK